MPTTHAAKFAKPVRHCATEPHWLRRWSWTNMKEAACQRGAAGDNRYTNQPMQPPCQQKRNVPERFLSKSSHEVGHGKRPIPTTSNVPSEAHRKHFRPSRGDAVAHTNAHIKRGVAREARDGPTKGLPTHGLASGAFRHTRIPSHEPPRTTNTKSVGRSRKGGLLARTLREAASRQIKRKLEVASQYADMEAMYDE